MSVKDSTATSNIASRSRTVEKMQQCAITFDVEWWARAHLVPAGTPPGEGLDNDIRAIHRILDYLDSTGLKATFFVVAGDFPRALIRSLTDRGHEVASHSMTHPHFGKLDQPNWAPEIEDSKRLLEDATGQAVTGFRAPSWSVAYDGQRRFYDLLARAGYQYSSSVCAFKTPLYGDTRFNRLPYETPQGIVEVPVPLVGFPAAPWVGGFYFRLAPLALTRYLVRKGSPAFLYFHPWEFYATPAKYRRGFITDYAREGNFEKFTGLIGSLVPEVEFKPLDSLSHDLALCAK